MKKSLIAAILLASTSILNAQIAPVFPARYEVSGVAEGLALNVRQGPSTRSEDIGDLKAGDVIEVFGVADSGRWAEIVWQGESAYVSLQFLSLVSDVTPVTAATPSAPEADADAEPAQQADTVIIEQPEAEPVIAYTGPDRPGPAELTSLTCTGTEPFWSMEVDPRWVRFNPMEGRRSREVVNFFAQSDNAGQSAYAITTPNVTVVAERRYCSDGMSDTQYDWSVTRVTTNEGVQSGCCTISE